MNIKIHKATNKKLVPYIGLRDDKVYKYTKNVCGNIDDYRVIKIDGVLFQISIDSNNNILNIFKSEGRRDEYFEETNDSIQMTWNS